MTKFCLRLLFGCLCVSVLGCANRRTEQVDAVANFVGREIILPDSISCQILDTPTDFCLNESDYAIIAYIDSSGCTPCRMKLQAWNDAINKFNFSEEVDVNFLMIINSTKRQEILDLLGREKFLHCICFDTNGEFARLNKLPKASEYHTFLLDENGKALLLGNPVKNPKIFDLYRKVIFGGEDDAIDAEAIPLGAACVGDSIERQFEIRNDSVAMLTLQGIATSCDCMSAKLSEDSIPQGEKAILTVGFSIDSVPGPIKKRVDVFFNEKECPMRYTLYGYAINSNIPKPKIQKE